MIVATGGLAYRVRMITREQIRAARGLLGWTQAELAKAAGLSEVAVKNLERGRTDPRASTLIAIKKRSTMPALFSSIRAIPATAGPACGLSSKA